MPSLNRVTFVGHLGKDPELRYLANGTAQTTFSLAVSRNFKDKRGEWQEETEWINVVVWAEAGERAAQHLQKGTLAYVEGRLSTRSWSDDQGVKHYRTEVIANQVIAFKEKGAAPSERPDDDDLPFE